jgi:DNA-directed RNA polymerase subunit RPC12/RpoP
MSKDGIAHCPECGHQFVVKKQRVGLKGALIGALVGSVTTVYLGPLAIGGALFGASAGMLADRKGPYCICPKCGATVDRPDC